MAKHPALFLALAFAGGVVCQSLLQLSLNLAALCFLFMTAFAWFHSARFKTSPHAWLIDAALLLAVLCAGLLRASFAEDLPPHEVSLLAKDDRELALLGRVLDTPEQRRDYARVPIAVLALREADSTSAALRGVVLASGKQLQSLGVDNEVILRGRLRLADEARNPGAFDYRAYLRANEICALFYASDSAPVVVRRSPSQWSLRKFSAHTRAWLEQRLASFSTRQNRALIKGLLLGQVEEIEPEIMTSFARTGLIHILSVSGLHVGFILLMLMMAASLLRLPRRWQWPLVLLALWFYAYLTGMEAPIVRAATMATVFFFGGTFERGANLPNNLGAAALLILMWQPLQLFQLGFQLSFLAMFGIAYLYRPLLFCFGRLLPWRWRIVRWSISLLAGSFAAQLATLPVSVTAFGRLPLTAIWGNLVVIPISFVTVAAAALACAFAPFSDFVMQAYGAVAEITAAFMIAFTHWLAALPFAYLEGVHLPPMLLLFYLTLLALFVFWRKKIRGRLVIAALLALNLYVWNEARHASPRLRVTFFDVGQGDAALLEFPRERRLLIDAGPWLGATDAGTRVLVPYLHRQGIRRINAVIISHPHGDHLGGLPALLHAIKIDTVYHGPVLADSELERRCFQLMDSLHVPHKALRAGERLLAFNPAHVTSLCSGLFTDEENLNEASLVMKVIYDKTTLLFPGDAERLSEAHLTQHRRALDSDLLKVGHHGSRTSSTEEFLRAVTPEWAVMSVGQFNRFDHPHQEVLARYERLGIHTLRTDQTGAVVFETEGEKLVRLR